MNYTEANELAEQIYAHPNVRHVDDNLSYSINYDGEGSGLIAVNRDGDGSGLLELYDLPPTMAPPVSLNDLFDRFEFLCIWSRS